jgi:hypothetical protein
MEEFLRNAVSLSWWIGVVLVGIATSAIAAYLKPWLDRLFGRFSRAWSTRTEARKQDFLERVRKASESEDVRADLRFEVLRTLLFGMSFMAFGLGIQILAVPVGNVVLLIVGKILTLLLLVVGATVITQDDTYEVLSQAKKKLDKRGIV